MQQENQFLRSLFDNAPFPYQSLDSDGRILSVNRAWQDELGYEKHEVLGRSFVDFVHSDHRENFRQRFVQFITDGRIQGAVWQLICKDGSTLHVSFSGRIAQDEDTRYPRTQCMFYDLNKRSESEEQLRESEELRMAFMESAEEGFALFDAELKLSYINAAGAQMLGMTAEDLVGRTMSNISPETTLAERDGLYQQVLATGKSVSIDEFAQPERFGGRVIANHAFRVGTNLGLILRDVTGAKIAARRLEESEARWRDLAEGSPDHVMILSRDLKIEHVNSGLLGHKVDALIGTYVCSHTAESRRDAARQSLEAVLETDRGTSFETIFVGADGKEVYHESNVVSRRLVGADDSETVGLIVSSRNISKRKSDEVRMDRLLERQTAMASLALGFSSDLDLTDVYRTTYRQVKAVMDPDVFIISHFDAVQDKVQAMYIVCDGEERAPEDICSPAAGPLAEVVRSGKPLVVSDYHTAKAESGVQNQLGLKGEETALPGSQDRGSLPSSALLVPMRVRDKVVGVMQVQSYQQAHYQSDDADLLAGLAGIAGVTIENRELIGQLKESYEGIIHALAKAIELRDPYTKQHQEGVALLARRIAEILGLPQEQLRAIELAANIHDIGKVIIPAEILSKPSHLSGAQMSIVQSHVMSAHEVLEDIAFPWDIDAIVLQHHERLDGSGYPQGLRGDAIRIESRILGVADIADAMMSHRPYRPAHSLEDTMSELLRLRGSALDEAVVDACLIVLKQTAAEA